MLVKVKELRSDGSGPRFVRVHSAVGTAVVLWRGAEPVAVGRDHHVEWTVDEGIAWAVNTWRSDDETPELREDGERIVLRGRLSLTADGAAVLDVDGSLILFDPSGPPLPAGVHGAWVEVHVSSDRVTVWPYDV